MRCRRTSRIARLRLAAGLGALLVTAASGCGQPSSNRTTATPTAIVATSPSVRASASPLASATATANPTVASSGPWSIVTSAPGLDLYGVTCVSADDCWAVGQGTGTLIEHDTGSGWSVVPSPNPPAASTNDMLQAVACANAGDCWAVGTNAATGPPQALIEQNTGSGWSILASPSPVGNQQDELNGVTCVSVDDCWAVGYYTDSAGNQDTLTEQYTGSGWSIVESPNPPGSGIGGSLSAVTCAAADDCWAVGAYGGGGATLGTLIEQYTGSGWTIVPGPGASDRDGSQLNAVTCVSADECWAVGYEQTGQEPLIEQYSGAAWSIITSPDPRTDGDNALSGVTCPSAGDCWAVGGDNMTGDPENFIDQYTGTGWSLVASPEPSTGSRLAGVTCASSTACWAVGDSGVDTEVGLSRTTLVEQYSQPSS
jgi:hypothetical protein